MTALLIYDRRDYCANGCTTACPPFCACQCHVPTCQECGDGIQAGGSEDYCQRCLYQDCRECGAELAVSRDDEDRLCAPCWNRLSITCANCQVLMLPDDAEPGDLCPSCAGKLVEDNAFTLGLESR